MKTQPGRPRDPKRREAILDAALDILAEDGYGALTMVNVAARSGASTATVYRRWPGKRELFLDALTLLARRAAEHPDAGPFPPPPDTGDVLDDMEILVHRLITLYTSRSGRLFSGLIHEFRRDPALAEAFRTRYLDPPRANTEHVLRRGIERGQLHEIPDLPLVAEACYGLVQTRALLTGEPLDRAFARRVVLAVLRPYLVKPPGSAAR
ncbi:TetR/AcrR family transcriptional regulator [Amycolatopsis lurida]